ncbi:hypothetical protein SAMN05216480_101652 [Pustulibacterium marinum]|uniref:Uncharacterized protein n=1 Tax=Pustulibacterium marinum TaxID=1224947 RepID=A0A1I7F5L5_9FLAO|nr:hypothetical protein SAMN05216480_101652 [Pustulibacterium marinum]
MEDQNWSKILIISNSNYKDVVINHNSEFYGHHFF